MKRARKPCNNGAWRSDATQGEHVISLPHECSNHPLALRKSHREAGNSKCSETLCRVPLLYSACAAAESKLAQERPASLVCRRAHGSRREGRGMGAYKARPARCSAACSAGGGELQTWPTMCGTQPTCGMQLLRGACSKWAAWCSESASGWLSMGKSMVGHAAVVSRTGHWLQILLLTA